MSKKWIAFDTNRIKDYVFETGTLKEIRGASALLDRLNREKMPEIVLQYLNKKKSGISITVVFTLSLAIDKFFWMFLSDGLNRCALS